MDSPFVGRRAERELLERALDDVAGGSMRAFVIAGDAGVGKTSLVRQVVGRAAERRFLHLVGTCAGPGRGLPYAPVRSAFRGLDDAARERVLRLVDQYPPLDLVVPVAPASALDPALEEHGAGLLFEGILTLLDELAADRPVLLAIEDLHWADRSSLELLAYLVRNLTDAAAVVCVTTRLDDLGPGSMVRAFVSELQRLPAVARIDLHGLARDELRELARGVLGSDPAEPFLDELEARTEGNPFYARELLVTGAVGGALPPTIRDALTTTLDALDDVAAHVVRAAAAIGREVNDELLGAVVEVPHVGFDDAVRAAVGAGIFEIGDHGLEFRHALLQEAAYSTLLPVERRRLHARIADELRSHPEWSKGVGIDAELAYHHDRAGQQAEAFAASVRAGEQALASFGFNEAYAHLGRAIDLWQEVPDAAAAAGRSEVELGLLAVDCAAQAGRVSEARAFAERLLAGADRAHAAAWASIAERVADMRWLDDDIAGAIALLDEAAALLADEPDTLEWARVHRRRAMMRGLATGSAADLPLAERALEIARAHGDRLLEAFALDTVGCLLAADGRLDEGMAMLDEGFALARDLGSAGTAARTGVNRMYALLISGRFEAAEGVALEAIEAIRTMGVERGYASDFFGGLARIRYLRGDWDGALDALQSAPRPPSARAASYLDLSAARLAMGRGDLDEAERLLEDAGRERSGNVFHLLGVAQTLTSLRILQGRSDEALAVAREALAQVQFAPDSSLIALIALALDALVRTGGDPAEAEHLRRRADEFVAQLAQRTAAPADVAPWYAIASAWVAEITGADPVPHWERAIEEFDRLEVPVEAAWCRIELAHRLVGARGDRDRAAALASDAHAVAQRVGAVPLEHFVRGLVHRARLEVDGIAPAPSAEQLGLTDREVSVLRLLADGRTNKEIADQLFISAKTASVHVSNILRKLGASTRVEAAAIAHRHGLAR